MARSEVRAGGNGRKGAEGITKPWLKAWAATYPAESDEQFERLAGKLAPTYEDVRAVIRWKSKRSLGYFARNHREAVESVVQRALASSDDLEALQLLTGLHGVKERVASAILAAFRPDRFTVMDTRAWRSLVRHGFLTDLEGESWRARWVPYLSTCREISARNELHLRAVDRALFRAAGTSGLPPSSRDIGRPL
jgi:hypothetical protein